MEAQLQTNKDIVWGNTWRLESAWESPRDHKVPGGQGSATEHRGSKGSGDSPAPVPSCPLPHARGAQGWQGAHSEPPCAIPMLQGVGAASAQARASVLERERARGACQDPPGQEHCWIVTRSGGEGQRHGRKDKTSSPCYNSALAGRMSPSRAIAGASSSSRGRARRDTGAGRTVPLPRSLRTRGQAWILAQ